MLFHIVLILIAIGVALWVANSLIPMESTMKKILNAVVIIAVVVWLLKVFGLWSQLRGV